VAIRVVLAEDNCEVRGALAQLIEHEADLDLIAVCRDGDELLDAIRAHEVDVVVTDVCMPPSMTNEGIRIAELLRRSHRHLGVILLSAYCEAGFALGLLESGCERRGYLLKERVHSGRQLTATIKAVAHGGSVVDPKVVDSLVDTRGGQRRSRLDTLSARERDVLVEMASGSSDLAIAESLGLPQDRVEQDVEAIFGKLSLPRVPDAGTRVRQILTFLAEHEPVARS
jgi:DNA-binding NarL/FixJ family response regulator